jgi:hypothetical protein
MLPWSHEVCNHRGQHQWLSVVLPKSAGHLNHFPSKSPRTWRSVGMWQKEYSLHLEKHVAKRTVTFSGMNCVKNPVMDEIKDGGPSSKNPLCRTHSSGSMGRGCCLLCFVTIRRSVTSRGLFKSHHIYYLWHVCPRDFQPSIEKNSTVVLRYAEEY